MIIKIEFAGLRKINRVNIFAYPETTQVQPSVDAKPITSMLIEYATDAGLTTWVAWSGLEDRSAEIGQTPTTIESGLVTGNLNTYNAFHDITGVDAYGVRITPYGSGEVALTEIEVWQTESIEDFNRINTDSSKDLVHNKYLAGIAAGTYVTIPTEYYPGHGHFQHLTAGDVNKMKARLYGGFTSRGVGYFGIMAHYSVYDWTVFQKSKKIEFRLKDRVKELRDASVFLADETLEGKTREWLIEWMGLKANLHSDEMRLFASEDIVNFFYPLAAKTWDEMNEIALGLDDVSLYVDRFNMLHFEVYLENIPYFWTVQAFADFEQCALNNLQLTTEAGRAVVKPEGDIEPTVAINDTGLYESGVETPRINQDKWYEVATQDFLADGDKMTLQLTYNVKGGVSVDPPYQFLGREKIQILDASDNLKTEIIGDGSATEYKENNATVDLSQWFADGETVRVKRWLLTKYQRVISFGVPIGDVWITSSTTLLKSSIYTRDFAGGDIVSYDKNLGITPTSWGAFELDSLGSGIRAYTDTSADGITWEGWKEVINGVVASALNQYIRWKVVMEERDLWGEIPKLYKVITAYNGGEGQTKYGGIEMTISDNDIKEIPLTFSDEVEGQRTQYDKVEIVVDPYILQPTEKLWEGDTGWMTEGGKDFDFAPQLENPVKIDGDYKLIINGLEFLEGETTQGGLIVNFHRHPIAPTLTIRQESAPVSIAEFYISGNQYEQNSREVFAAGDGNKVLRIENKYINSASFAQDMADKKLYGLQEVRESIARDLEIHWNPLLKFQGLISIKNEELGFTRLYQIYNIAHSFNGLSDLEVNTKIRAQEINIDSLFDAGYWGGELSEGAQLFWGLDSPSAEVKYWGGQLYG